MKELLAAAALLAAFSQPAAAQDAHHAGGHHDKGAQQAGADASGVIRRGEPVGDSERVALADVLKEPRKYAGRTVRVEGVVNRVCQKEGCWVEISPDGDDGVGAVRVTFDHKFSVPKDAGRMKFRAEGVFSLKTLSKEHVEHLVKDDGAKIRTNPDGTADEVSFLATGVELWK
ncbi:MAG TPA: DUF4920 domain-containing protein [Pyrinomonadaceae bacterium]|nr:DUF4920 domain-containing protein [Pyrinomonadaceae bacterium]